MFIDGLILFCVASVLDLQPRLHVWPGIVRVLAVGLMIYSVFVAVLGLVLKHGTLDLWEAIIK